MSRNVEKSAIAHLPAHFRIEGRPIENDVELIWFFARQNGFNNRFRLKKIVPQDLARLGLELTFNGDFLLLLRFARALTLLLH